MQPEVIILDEPTAGLDPVGVSELMHLLKRVCKQQNTTIILSTHDIDVIPVYADEIFVMDKGKLLAKGSPKEIFPSRSCFAPTTCACPACLICLKSCKRGWA